MAKSGRRDVVPSKGDKSGWDVTQPSSKQPISHHKNAGERREGGEA